MNSHTTRCPQNTDNILFKLYTQIHIINHHHNYPKCSNISEQYQQESAKKIYNAAEACRRSYKIKEKKKEREEHKK